MAAPHAALSAPAFCVRCGSGKTQILGETPVSAFFSCMHCRYVWSVPRRELLQWPVSTGLLADSVLVEKKTR